MKVNYAIFFKGLVFVALVLCTFLASAQAPAISWQKSLGGSDYDYAYSIQQTTDGGYIVAGHGYGPYFLGNHGYDDYWIIKLDANGTISWQKCLGGSEWDEAHSIQQTSDGGYIVAGYSYSNNGDVMGSHGGYPFSDCWIVKLTANGTISWQKCLGGSERDEANSIQQTSDGGYIMAGRSYSNNGDVTGHHGSADSSDCWIVKLTANGTISWQKSLGGSYDDRAYSIQQTADGGYIMAGHSYSNNGDVTGHHGSADSSDCWIVKLTANGTISWQKSLGGSGTDWATSIQQTVDGGYIVTGSSCSNNGDVTGNHGGYDFWIVKLDTNGDISWQKSLGGSATEVGYSIQQTADGGYIVAGYSSSNDGDVTINHGNGYPDYWIVKLDANGTISWQKSLGGSYDEAASSIQQTADGGYIVAGRSSSTNGDVSGNHGNSDYWIVKLGGTTAINSNFIWEGVSIYPNPNKGDFLLEGIQEGDYPLEISITDISGRAVYQQKYSFFSESIPLHLQMPKGLYFLKVQSEKGIAHQKFVVE